MDELIFTVYGDLELADARSLGIQPIVPKSVTRIGHSPFAAAPAQRVC